MGRLEIVALRYCRKRACTCIFKRNKNGSSGDCGIEIL